MKNENLSKSAQISYMGKIYLLTDAPREKLRLTPPEEKILNTRLTKNSIIQFPTEELQDKMDEILKVISAISGLPLPTNDGMGTVLKTELITFLMDFGYKLLNEDEIALAFRLNISSTVRFSDGTYMPVIEPVGNFLNVLYCAKVLSNYLIIRNMLDRKAQNVIEGYSGD